MDRDLQELQSLGFFGIFSESLKLIFSWKKIFSKITLTLILPLSSIYLAHSLISILIFHQSDYYGLSDLNLTSSQLGAFWLFKLGYFAFSLIFALFSTSAVVYTIACIYTAKETTYRKVMRVVPKVWKRLIITYLWMLGIYVVYHIVAIGVFVLWAVAIGSTVIGAVVVVVFMILYLTGLVYISLIWIMASVISVLEDVYGRKSLSKARKLLKGKMGVAVGMFLVVVFGFAGVYVAFESVVIIDVLSNLGARIGIGILCLLLLTMVMLFELVEQTVIYFVCKSYHHEIIDRSSLSDHLEEYLGDYVRLNPNRNVQLEQVHV